MKDENARPSVGKDKKIARHKLTTRESPEEKNSEVLKPSKGPSYARLEMQDLVLKTALNAKNFKRWGRRSQRDSNLGGGFEGLTGESTLTPQGNQPRASISKEVGSLIRLSSCARTQKK